MGQGISARRRLGGAILLLGCEAEGSSVNQYNDAPEERGRVYGRIAPLIMTFYQDYAGKRFRAEDLRQYVLKAAPEIAPGSPDRILRELRLEGKIDYIVLNRRESLYLFRNTPPCSKGSNMTETEVEIVIDANRADEEPDRLTRLRILRDILVYYQDYFCDSSSAKVVSLYDHKGTLSVDWNAAPTKEQKEMVDSFWDAVFFETEVEHYIREDDDAA
jgi:hypothetical protein